MIQHLSLAALSVKGNGSGSFLFNIFLGKNDLKENCVKFLDCVLL